MHRRQLLAGGAALAVGLAGCSGDGDEDGDPAEEDEADPTESPTPTATPPPEGSARPTDSPTETDDTSETATGDRVTDVALGSPHPSFAVGPGNTGSGGGRGPTADLVREAWTRTVPERPSPPVVAGETVYVTADGTLHALALADGGERWTQEGAVGTPAVAGGAVFVAGDPVRALAPADGGVRWQAPIGSRESLTLAGGTLYLVDRTGPLAALDAETGSREWSLERPTRYSEFRAPPAVGGGTVVVPLELRTDGPPGRVVAVDAATGEPRWRRDLGGYPEHPAVVRDGAAYVAAGATVRRLSLADGRETWRYEASARVTAPLAIGSFCFVGTESGELYALDPDSGEEQAVLERGQLPIVGVTASNGVYLGTDASAGDARRLDSWAFQIDGGITTPPALADGHYVVGSRVLDEGQVTALVDDG